MPNRPSDPGFDTLLDLDGQVFFIDERAHYWVKFSVRRVEADERRPHGLRYSLTLHNARGERVVGFDNAHAAGDGESAALDHRHRLRTIRAYEYKDAASLLADFWREVDAVMKELGE